MGTLRYRIVNDVALADLLERMADLLDQPLEAPTFLLAQSRAAYQIGVVREGRLWTGGGDIATDAHSIRLFCSTWETRWSRQPEATSGRLVVVGESTGSAPSPSSATASAERSLAFLGALDGGYLLWGETLPSGNSGSAVTLAEHRIGSLKLPSEAAGLPHASSRGSRYRLESREYFGEVESGNVAVIEERLLGFRSVTVGTKSP